MLYVVELVPAEWWARRVMDRCSEDRLFGPRQGLGRPAPQELVNVVLCVRRSRDAWLMFDLAPTLRARHWSLRPVRGTSPLRKQHE